MKRHSGFIVETSLYRNKRMKVQENTTIYHLPAEVMLIIFKLLTPSERLKVMTVSSNWLNILLRYFSQDFRITITKKIDLDEFSRTFSKRLDTIKEKRAISSVLLKWFPTGSGEMMELNRVFDSIGEEIEELKIDVGRFVWISDDIFRDFYSKIPNLKSLEVTDIRFAGEISALKNLKSITVNYGIGVVQYFQKIRKMGTVKTFKCKWITITPILYKNHIFSNNFMNKNMKNLLQEMLGPEDIFSCISLKSNFNYADDSEMTPDDVSEITINLKAASITPLIHFNNLKKIRLEFYSNDGLFTSFNAQETKYYHITHLNLKNLGTQSLTTKESFQEMLQSFPNLESLMIRGFFLENDAFTHICRYLPKLKELKLMNGLKHNKISLESILKTDGFSLKDLKYLEVLNIESSYPTHQNYPELLWPKLPKLKELTLTGNCFDWFYDSIMLPMTSNCPNIAKFEFNVKTILNEDQHAILLSNCGDELTHLSVPGEADEDDSDANEFLVLILVEYCKKLQELEIKDHAGFSLADELELFSELPSLKKITCKIINNTTLCHITRTITRSNTEDLKNYLVDNLKLYTNLKETIDYVYNNEITMRQRTAFVRSFEKEFPNNVSNATKIMFIVTKDFLKMNEFKYCELLSRF